MKTWMGGVFGILLLLGACNQVKNPLNIGLFKAGESQYQTTTEETKAALNLSNQPIVDVPAPPPGPSPPPPLLDPLTSGPALPPPPPNFDDEGVPSRPLVVVPRCGDRILEPAEVASVDGTLTVVHAGEQCEDGNNISGDGCSDICVEEFCGNGYVEPEHGEECDGGLPFPIIPPDSTLPIIWGNPRAPQAWNCDKYCRLIICGNGRVELGGNIYSWQKPAPGPIQVAEECDLGPRNGGCSGCTTKCTIDNVCQADKICTCNQQ